jgi:hypothetical protein
MMVFTIQCPNPKCRKFMLVEDEQRNKVTNCLVCKEPIKVGAGPVAGKEQKAAGDQASRP